MTFANKHPRAAYIHVPFCRHRCGYCNYTLVAGRSDLIEPYLEAIAWELETIKPVGPVDTIFFGGGTPTQLPAKALRRLGQMIVAAMPLAKNYEWSIEGNPADISAELVETIADLGINRVSLGCQSLNASKLELLQRDHRAEDIIRAYELLRPAVPAIAFDLIFAAPKETYEDWLVDLDGATAIVPDHVSTYGLTYERGTTYWGRRLRGELISADDELERAMYEAAIEHLSATGFEHYEVSNFAKPGHRSRHNENYWRGGPFYGFGPGAASYLSGRRAVNHRSTTTYLKLIESGTSPIAESEQLGAEDAARERFVFGMRMLEGVDLPQFHADSGFDPRLLFGDEIDQMVSAGLFEQTGHCVRLTRDGLMVSDAIWPKFLRC